MSAAPERFCITIEGSIARLRERTLIDDGRGLTSLVQHLLGGQDVPDDCWRPYGLRVTIDDDMDQGDE